MTVNDGYTLKDSDYPTVPTKAGYSGAWQQYTEAIHADITIQATYTALAQYTVKFVADGVTVKTMTVYEGYVLKTADYPTVPEKAGYSGSWRRRTTAITSDVTIQAVYTVIQHNVKFVVLRRTVKTLTVSDGYILHSGDYPTLPDGYGWTRNTDPIHSDITVTAIEGTSKPLVTFTGNGVTAKIMAVNRGYKLKDSDYPSVPEKKGYLGTWTKYTDAIYEDITVTATYKRSEIIKPPIRPTGVVASEDLPEPIEPQDVIKPEDNAETLSNRSNQTLISTQTITHEYLTLSGKVVRETVRKNGSVTDVMDFVYDESGRPFALIHQTDGVGITLCTYYYVLNLQGDVVKLVTASGDVVANYEYDAWGNILSQSGEMASINPLRYRGYYYDSETGFYYLQSRYYDPVNRRFINADSYASTGQGFVGTNMFAYCNNCPVVYYDPSGRAANPGANTSAINDGVTGTGGSVEVLSVTLYNTELDAIVGFAEKYTTVSKVRHSEIGGYVYRLSANGREHYYLGTISAGAESKMRIFAPGMWVDENLSNNSTAVAMVHTHPAKGGLATLFSDNDISARQYYIPDGNSYIATLDYEIYMFDRERQVQQGIFVTSFTPNALGGNNSPYKRYSCCLV